MIGVEKPEASRCALIEGSNRLPQASDSLAEAEKGFEKDPDAFWSIATVVEQDGIYADLDPAASRSPLVGQDPPNDQLANFPKMRAPAIHTPMPVPRLVRMKFKTTRDTRLRYQPRRVCASSRRARKSR